MNAVLAYKPTGQWFELPRSNMATSPATHRGLRSDEIRLMVTTPTSIDHRQFSDLENVLVAGDLLVVNDSATIPAAVDIDSERVVHFSTTLDGGFQVVEIRDRDWRGSVRRLDIERGVIRLPGGATLELLARYPVGSRSGRLWLAVATMDKQLHQYLARHGRPITYDRETLRLPISEYQTVFSRVDGSAEMPSAALPFTERLVTRLVRKGVRVAPVTLHTGVSSLEVGEPPYPEWYEVPAPTATLINQTRASGHRVIAVGTTVVRALETVGQSDTFVYPGRGWTDLHINGERTISSVDGMVTGWHEPKSSHLEMLTALAGMELIVDSYQAALAEGYLWHEFGDSQLILR